MRSGRLPLAASAGGHRGQLTGNASPSPFGRARAAAGGDSETHPAEK